MSGELCRQLSRGVVSEKHTSQLIAVRVAGRRLRWAGGRVFAAEATAVNVVGQVSGVAHVRDRFGWQSLGQAVFDFDDGGVYVAEFDAWDDILRTPARWRSIDGPALFRAIAADAVWCGLVKTCALRTVPRLPVAIAS